MTVADFIKSQNITGNVKRKAKKVWNENVLELGNDVWLAWELDMSVAEIERIAKQKK